MFDVLESRSKASQLAPIPNNQRSAIQKSRLSDDGTGHEKSKLNVLRPPSAKSNIDFIDGSNNATNSNTGGRRFSRIKDMSEDPNLYIQTLRDMEVYVKTALSKTAERTNNLSKFLPVNERTGMNKEAKVIAKWQERQRDWDKINSDLSNRLKTPASHSLMMAKSDEYRARYEEYEFLRAAVPYHERCASDNIFEWTLRNRTHTTQIVTVGHAFSGLYTEVSDEVKPPLIMRKPKPLSSLRNRSNATTGIVKLVDEGEYLKEKKEKYGKYLTALRPHVITMEDAAGLYVKSTDMFEWAIETSHEYFEEIRAAKEKSQENRQNLAKKRRGSFEEAHSRLRSRSQSPATPGTLSARQQRGSFFGASRQVSIRNSKAGGVYDSSTSGKGDTTAAEGSRILFMSPEELIFSSQVGEAVSRPVLFKNTGAVACHYEWKRFVEIETLEPPLVSTVTSALVNDHHAPIPKEKHVAEQRITILCGQKAGIIQPGEVVRTLFSFCNKAAPGVIVETWELITNPRTNIAMDPQVFLTEEAANNRKKAVNSGLNESMLKALDATVESLAHLNLATPEYIAVSPMQMRIRGHTIEPDVNINSRLHCAENITLKCDEAFVSNVQQLQKRYIRPALMYEELNKRKVDLFKQINAETLSSLCGSFGNNFPLFITIERVEAFEKLSKKTQNLHNSSIKRIKDLMQLERMILESVQDSYSYDSQGGLLIENSNSEVVNNNLNNFDMVPMDQKMREMNVDLTPVYNPLSSKDKMRKMKRFLFPERRLVSLKPIAS